MGTKDCGRKCGSEFSFAQEEKNRAFVLGRCGLQLLIHRIFSVKLDAAENPPPLALIVTTYAPLGVPGEL